MDYSDTYNEQLPEDWLKIIDSSPCIHVQKVVNNYTLRHCKPEEVRQLVLTVGDLKLFLITQDRPRVTYLFLMRNCTFGNHFFYQKNENC